MIFFPKASPMLGFSFSCLPREGSETEVPDERGWDVKRGNSLGGAPQEGARQECRTSVDGM